MNLKDAGFVAQNEAAAHRQALVSQCVAAFRDVEVGSLERAASGLKDLAKSVSTRVASGEQASIKTLIDGQLAKLA